MNEHRTEPMTGVSGDAADPEAELAAARAEIAQLHWLLQEARKGEAIARDREQQSRSAEEFRIRNMLAIVRSLFSRTVAAGETLDEVVDHFRGRFDVFARYQASVGRSSGGRDLESLIWDELRNFEFDDRIAISGPECLVSDDVALMIGLAIHELVTNSIKFGALSHATGGAIAIGWTLSGDMLSLRWEETGVSIVAAAPVKPGFGREFIEHALPYQFDTPSTFELRPGGVLCTIVAPLDGIGTRKMVL